MFVHLPLLARLASVITSIVFGAFAAEPPRVITENFDSNPLPRGWELFGDPELFVWNAEQQNLHVTIDSSRSNTFLFLPLGMTLNRADDFSASLDLTLSEIAPATTEGKAGALQLAFGFHNQTNAQAPNFIRGTSTDSPNLVEFTFFPDTGFGPTVWPAALSTNSGMNYNGPQDFSIFDLPLHVTMRIALSYRATEETVTVSVSTNGTLVGPVTSAKLSTNSSAFSQPFTDFRVDAFALPSYSDLGQEGEFAGSLFARGVIDNVEVRVPPLPIRDLVIGLVSGAAEVSFLSRESYTYTLESTSNFENWSPAGESIPGTGGRVHLSNESGGLPHRFFRIVAQRN